MNHKRLICGVCGEKAIARNFGALTCGPCKSFFRRNSGKINLKCHFADKCEISTITRKLCQKCRLDKCFNIGMKKEWVLNEEEKELRRIKVELNRQKRQNSDTNTTKLFDYKIELPSKLKSIPNKSIITSIVSNETIDYFHNFADVFKYYENNNNFDINYEEINEKIIDSNNLINNKAVNENLKESEFTFVPISRPITDYNNNFNELEGIYLTELLNASHMFKIPLSENRKVITTAEELSKALSLKFHIEIKSLVNLSKCLNAFNDICENDRIILVKYSSIEIILMRSIICYYSDTQSICFPMDSDNSVNFRLDVLKQNKRNIYTYFKNYVQKLGSIFDKTESVIIFSLLAIILFNPNRPNILHKEMIQYQRFKYMYLLKRYLVLRYRSESEANSRFIRIMNTLNDLYIVSEIQKKNSSEDLAKYSQYSEPLLIEVFDVNS